MTAAVIQLETYSVPDCSEAGTRSLPGLDIFIKRTLPFPCAGAKNTSEQPKLRGGRLCALSEAGVGQTPDGGAPDSFRKAAPDTNITTRKGSVPVRRDP